MENLSRSDFHLFYIAVGKPTVCKRPCFALQNTTFCFIKRGLLPAEIRPFVKSLALNQYVVDIQTLTDYGLFVS